MVVEKLKLDNKVKDMKNKVQVNYLFHFLEYGQPSFTNYQ